MNKALIIALASLLAPLAAQAAEPVAALVKPAQPAPAPAAAQKPATPQKTAASPTAAATSQQERMRNCNKEATGKKGDERKAFMKTCLSSKS
jgi:hypothetical protein